MAKVRPDATPQSTPCVARSPGSKLGTKTTMPAKVTMARTTSIVRSFSWKKSGSRKVTKTGNVENVMSAKATLEVCTD